jgi:hypothetical protein
VAECINPTTYSAARCVVIPDSAVPNEDLCGRATTLCRHSVCSSVFDHTDRCRAIWRYRSIVGTTGEYANESHRSTHAMFYVMDNQRLQYTCR